MEIGNKKEDPYVFKNMEKALKELVIKDKKYKEFVIKPNYKYVKIVALNEQGNAEITALKDFDVYFHPIDVKINKNGNKYSDPDNQTSFSSFWLVVPFNYKFTANIKEKLLEEVLIPFGTGKDYIKYDLETEAIYKSIEAKSIELLYPKLKNAKINVIASGNIKVEEDTLTQIIYGTSGTKFFTPIKGVKVSARNFLRTRSANTDNDGNFTINYNFSGNIDEFNISWESSDFYLVDGSGNLAKTTQTTASTPPITGNYWAPSITRAINPVEFRYAHVFRGAYHYYNLPANDLKVPPKFQSPSLLCNNRSQLEIKVKNGSQSHFWGSNQNVCKASVVIENTIPTASVSNVTFKGYYMFASVSHELTHAKHWALPGGMSDLKYCAGGDNYGALAESYAMMGEYYLVNKEYSNITPIPFIWNQENFDRRRLQYRQISVWNNKSANCLTNAERYYTPYFIDLMDSKNQSIAINALFPNDQVYGYTAKFLEDCLLTSPDDWYNINAKIKNPGSIPIPVGVQGNSNTNIDYLYLLYKIQ